MNKENKWLPFLAAILANVIWGSTFLASKKVLAIAPAFSAISARFLIGIVVLFLVGLLRRNNFQQKLVMKNFWPLLKLSVIYYTILYSSQMIGLKTISSALSAVIMLFAPIFSILIESIKTRKMTKTDGLSVVVGFIGALILISGKTSTFGENNSLVGILLTLIASFCLGFGVILTKQFQENSQKNWGEKLSIFNLTFYSMVIGTIGILPFSISEILTGKFSLQNIPNEFYLWSLYLGVICSVLAFLLWNWAVVNASSIVTAVSMYLKTPVAIILAAIILGEQLSNGFVVGFLLILFPLLIKQIILVRGKA